MEKGINGQVLTVQMYKCLYFIADSFATRNLGKGIVCVRLDDKLYSSTCVDIICTKQVNVFYAFTPCVWFEREQKITGFAWQEKELRRVCQAAHQCAINVEVSKQKSKKRLNDCQGKTNVSACN